MFNLTIKAADLTVTAVTPLRAATLKTLKGSTVADVATYNAIREYVALQTAGDAIDADLSARALAALKDVKTPESYKAARSQFLHVYALDYEKRVGEVDKAKLKAALDVAWSRFCKRAESKGWARPVLTSQTAKAVKARAQRAKASAAKPDGRTTRHAGKPSAIVAEVKADPELSAALQWVNSDAAHKAAFIAWFKAQRVAELAPAAKVA